MLEGIKERVKSAIMEECKESERAGFVLKDEEVNRFCENQITVDYGKIEYQNIDEVGAAAHFVAPIKADADCIILVLPIKGVSTRVGVACILEIILESGLGIIIGTMIGSGIAAVVGVADIAAVSVFAAGSAAAVAAGVAGAAAGVTVVSSVSLHAHRFARVTAFVAGFAASVTGCVAIFLHTESATNVAIFSFFAASVAGAGAASATGHVSLEDFPDGFAGVAAVGVCIFTGIACIAHSAAITTVVTSVGGVAVVAGVVAGVAAHVAVAKFAVVAVGVAAGVTAGVAAGVTGIYAAGAAALAGSVVALAAGGARSIAAGRARVAGIAASVACVSAVVAGVPGNVGVLGVVCVALLAVVGVIVDDTGGIVGVAVAAGLCCWSLGTYFGIHAGGRVSIARAIGFSLGSTGYLGGLIAIAVCKPAAAIAGGLVSAVVNKVFALQLFDDAGAPVSVLAIVAVVAFDGAIAAALAIVTGAAVVALAAAAITAGVPARVAVVATFVGAGVCYFSLGAGFGSSSAGHGDLSFIGLTFGVGVVIASGVAAGIGVAGAAAGVTAGVTARVAAVAGITIVVVARATSGGIAGDVADIVVASVAAVAAVTGVSDFVAGVGFPWRSVAIADAFGGRKVHVRDIFKHLPNAWEDGDQPAQMHCTVKGTLPSALREYMY